MTQKSFKVHYEGGFGEDKNCGALVVEKRCTIEIDGANTSFFYILNQFGSFLEGYFNKLSGNYMNLVSVYSLGIKLLN